MAVAFDAVGPSSAGTAVAGNTSLTWSHTCSGSNRVLVVSVSIGIIGDTGITTSVTYNSIPMTSAGIIHSNNSTDGYVQMFYLIAPATGTNTVAVTTNASVDIIAGSVSFTGAHQTTPLINVATNAGSGTTANVSVTNSSGNMVIDGVCCGSGFVAGSTQTQRWLNSLNSNTAAGSGAQATSTSTGSVAMSYDMNTDWWGMVGASVQAAPSVPVVTTGSITNISGTTATGNGTVVSDSGATITERGICWSTSVNPTTSDSKATAAGTTGSYSAAITGLSNGATYHARAYAINANGTAYGADIVFQMYNVAVSWLSV